MEPKVLTNDISLYDVLIEAESYFRQQAKTFAGYRDEAWWTNLATRAAAEAAKACSAHEPKLPQANETRFREALARIASGFYTEHGAEQHAKDILRLADSADESEPVNRYHCMACGAPYSTITMLDAHEEHCNGQRTKP